MNAGRSKTDRNVSVRERHSELSDAIERAMISGQATAKMALALSSPKSVSSSVCLLLSMTLKQLVDVHTRAERLGQALNALKEAPSHG